MPRYKINYVIPDKIAKKLSDKRTTEYKNYEKFLNDKENFNKIYTTIARFSYSEFYGNRTSHEYSNYFVKKYLRKYYSHIKLDIVSLHGVINIRENYLKTNMRLTNYMYSNMKKHLQSFFKSNKRFLINPVHLIWYRSNISHANILLVDKKKKSIVLIEPYGKLLRMKTQNQIIREIKKIFSKEILEEYRFVNPDFLESGLLQSKKERFDSANCVLYSLYIAIFFVINKEKKLSYNELFNILKQKFNPEKDKKKNVNLRLKKYIKKFVYLLSKLNIPYKSFYNKNVKIY